MMESLPYLKDVVAFYNDLTLSIVPGPRSLSYLAPFLIPPLALLLPPSVLSYGQIRSLILPLSISTQVYVWLCHDSFDVLSINNALWTFTLLGYYDARKDFTRIIRSSPPQLHGGLKSCHGHAVERAAASTAESISEAPVTNAIEPDSLRRPATTAKGKSLPSGLILQSYPSTSLRPRMTWVFVLFTSLRLSDFYVGSPTHDALQAGMQRPTRSFYRNVIYQALFSYVLLGQAAINCPASHSFPDQHNLRNYHTPRLDLSWLHASNDPSGATVPMTFTAALLLALPLLVLPSFHHSADPLTDLSSHLSFPQTIYTSPHPGLRAFWGTFWHQNMRHTTTTPGLALASRLRLGRGSISRYMLVVTSAFFFSGIVHMGVVPPQPLETTYTAAELRLLVAAFFWMQVIGIAIEAFLEYVLSRELGFPKPDPDRAVEPATRKGDVVRRGVVLNAIICLWVVAYLALTASYTLRVVGRELRWWGVLSIPYTFAKRLLEGSRRSWL